jgi:hypothetical protein
VKVWLKKLAPQKARDYFGLIAGCFAIPAILLLIYAELFLK